MASPRRYPTDDTVHLPHLTLDDVSSASKLQKILEPLLRQRGVQLGLFHVLIPSVPRDCGGVTKSFLFLAGLRKLTNTDLFPGPRVELNRMSPQQRAAYEEWCENKRAEYACLYSTTEWEENEKLCKKVYSAKWNKVSQSQQRSLVWAHSH